MVGDEENKIVSLWATAAIEQRGMALERKMFIQHPQSLFQTLLETVHAYREFIGKIICELFLNLLPTLIILF